ncbi:prepilin-type N-terminal cleavage/methylation domain-containing protein [Salsuginibacillus kocurii]|uniref:prepilin-type N-terminal cleavage/methylation domain-containing protein n=1 Tax=Salsuginibacillus kocurii TaxID=427078 RepID=UPI00037A5815|nr:prepilin-type N-terminal cleavage/methylation domain-containing protein [Salsuginibacillus kocurii]
MRNQTGLTLIEVLTGLFLVSFIATVMVPVLVATYEERMAVKEEREVLLYLQAHVQAILHEGEKPSPLSFDYELSHNKASRQWCVHWLADNNQAKKRCEYYEN